MVKAIIIDDEERNIDVLSNLVGSFCPDVYLAGTANDADTAISLIKTLSPDMIFLDIEMTGKNGFDILEAFPEPGFEVIFVTAYEKYAVKAFRYEASDYILKPVNIEELQEAVSRTVKKIQQKNTQPIEKTLLAEPQKIALYADKTTSFENIEDILFISSKQNYSEVHLTGNKTKLIAKGLSYFEENLPSSMFMRIHNSYIINLNQVRQYIEGRGGEVNMSDGTKINVAVRKKKALLAGLMKQKTSPS